MTPNHLRNAGAALHGPLLVSGLAVNLDVDERTVQRWLAGTKPIPDNLGNEIRAVVAKRVAELGKAVEGL